MVINRGPWVHASEQLPHRGQMWLALGVNRMFGYPLRSLASDVSRCEDTARDRHGRAGALVCALAHGISERSSVGQLAAIYHPDVE